MISDVFTDLSAAAATGAPQGMQALWKAVFELPEWCFLQQMGPDGQPPPGPPPIGRPTPLIVRVDGKRWVAAFTSSDRAFEAAQHNGLVHPQLGIPILRISTDGAAIMLCEMDHSAIDGVLFNRNEGQQAFFAPLGNIAPMYEWNLDRLPAKLFDPFVRGVRQSNAPQAWARLNRRIAMMDQWFFIGDKERPKAPRLLTHDGRTYVLIFTDAEHARRGGAKLGETAPDETPLIPAPPAGAAAFLLKMQEHSQGQIKEALFNLGSEAFAKTIEDLDRFVAFR